MGLSTIGAIPLTIVGATGGSIVGAMACWASVQHADRTDQRAAGVTVCAHVRDGLQLRRRHSVRRTYRRQLVAPTSIQ